MKVNCVLRLVFKVDCCRRLLLLKTVTCVWGNFRSLNPIVVVGLSRMKGVLLFKDDFFLSTDDFRIVVCYSGDCDCRCYWRTS